MPEGIRTRRICIKAARLPDRGHALVLDERADFNINSRRDGGLEVIPRAGDVLVAKPTAAHEHEISVVPQQHQLTCATHDLAVAKAKELAEQLHVDAWLTEDHTHFLKLASHRET